MYKAIQSYLGQVWADFQQLFADSLVSGIKLLDKANTFILEHGGKKLRPMVTLLTAKALRGFCGENVIRCAAASELLHTGTLIHDDVADDSSLRRGVPTAKALYPAGTAVLLGDFWLSRAIHLIVDHPDRRVLHAYAKCLGDLAEGEMLQLEKAGHADSTEEDYRKIIYCKTTSLFEASILSAAYTQKADDAELASFGKYAFHVGQSFQMMDDILDYSPDLSSGKPTGQDIMEQKVTLPLLCLFDCAPKSVVSEIRRRLKKPDEELVFDIFSRVGQYGAMDLAREKLLAETRLAVQALDPVPDSQAKDYLVKLAESQTFRTA